jgi:hypothetical protein
MKTKRFLPAAALLAVTAIASCSKEPDVDKRDQFVGTYSVARTVTTTGNTVLVNDSMMIAVGKSAEDNFTAKVGFSIQSFAVEMELTTDSVFWHQAAGKSCVFKIPEQAVKISGVTAGSVQGASLGSTVYQGSFGYDNVGAPKVSLRVTGSLTPLPNMVIPINVTISGTIVK